jgi:hypothetical protein
VVYAEVTFRDDALKLSVGRSVGCDCYCGVARLLDESQNLVDCLVRADV